MTCTATSSQTQGGLTVDVMAECSRRCTVDGSGTDTHTIVATNVSLITWAITFEGECTTPDIEYQGLGSKWPSRTITVPGWPGKGKAMVVPARQPLVSVRPDPHQLIRTDLRISDAQTGVQAGVDVLWLQVETT